MILHTTKVRILADYKLFLKFNTGESGVVNLANELDGDVFETLLDQGLFATAYQHPIMKTVAWANGVDIAPECLLELMQNQKRIAA